MFKYVVVTATNPIILWGVCVSRCFISNYYVDVCSIHTSVHTYINFVFPDANLC